MIEFLGYYLLLQTDIREYMPIDNTKTKATRPLEPIALIDDIKRVFSGHTCLTSIEIPESITIIKSATGTKLHERSGSV